MKTNALTFIALLTALSLVTLGCSDTSTDALSSSDDDSVQIAVSKGKPSGGGGGKGGGGGDGGGDTAPRTVSADVVADADFVSVDPQIASTCSGRVTENFGVIFGEIGSPENCLDLTFDSVSLTDDVQLNVKTKNGYITQVLLRGQDKSGSDGIMHESETITIDPPVEINPAGFTFHIHAVDVPVWRLSGHLRGKRVAVIGTATIGDVVYHAP